MSNNKIRKKLAIVGLVGLVGLTLFNISKIAIAGPLDRGDMQTRQNPTSNNMIRVPGVLGQSERYALETLQRAGLNVKTQYIRKTMKKYAGRNGTAVKQIPSAGGLAMLGSSISITVYKVDGEPLVDTGRGYGDSGYGSNNSYDDQSDIEGGRNRGYDAEGSDSGAGYDGAGYADPADDGTGDTGRGYGAGETGSEDNSSGPDWGGSSPERGW